MCLQSPKIYTVNEKVRIQRPEVAPSIQAAAAVLDAGAAAEQDGLSKF